MRKSSKRRITNKELDELKNIENLLGELKKEKQTVHKPIVEQPKMEVLEPVVNKVKDIKITEHAYQRIEERLNMSDRKQAANYIKGWLKSSNRIGYTFDEHGNRSVLYARGRIAIILDEEETCIRTVYKQERVTYEPIKCKIAEMHEKEVRKLDRLEKSKARQLHNIQLEANLEIAQCELRMHRTRSQAVKNACQARINAIRERLEELENEIKEIQLNKKSVYNSMVAVV